MFRDQRKASETSARTDSVNSVGVGTHARDMRTNTESEDLETICDQISGDQPETGSCDRHQQCTGRICLDISWETLPALMYRLPNVAAYYTHVNMLGHKKRRRNAAKVAPTPLAHFTTSPGLSGWLTPS